MSSPMKSSAKSTPALKLPALWLNIFEFALGLSIDPAAYCNHFNFPYILRHLHRPCDFPAVISPSRRDLRLVCRYFNALLQPSQSLYMNDLSTIIPATTRELYISPQPTPHTSLQRLLAHPSVSNRIVMLSLLGYERSSLSSAGAFDFLYDNSHSLAAVRTLALSLRIPYTAAPAIPRFWFRLNEAFPNLTCLVLCGHLETSYPDPVVELKKLEVLAWDQPTIHVSLQFSGLRHVSFGRYLFGLLEFARWPHLESLMFRIVDWRIRFDWGLFPNLRLLGLPAERIDVFPQLPPNHPLQHLYVFFGIRPRDDHLQHLFGSVMEQAWLTKTIERMPGITRLTLCFDEYSQGRLGWISGQFCEEDMVLLGFTRRYVPEANSENGYHDVFEREKVKTRIENDIITSKESVQQRRRFHLGWNKFVQLISRRLHI